MIARADVSPDAMFDMVTCYVEVYGWTYQVWEPGKVLWTAVPEWQSPLKLPAGRSSLNTPMGLVVSTDDENRHISILGMSTLTISRKRMPVMAELTTRLNHCNRLGWWQLDYSKRVMAFQANLFLWPDGQLTPRMLQTLFCGTIAAVDRLHPFIVDVIEGRRSPEEAVIAQDLFREGR